MKKGFTLLELLIVVVVIGILAVAAIPQYNKVIEKATSADARNVLAILRTSQLRYYTDKAGQGSATFASTVTDLDVENVNPGKFTITVASDATKDIATATRKSGGNFSYTVGINSAGTFSCTGGTGACSAVGL